MRCATTITATTKRCFSPAINSIADKISRQRQAEAAENAKRAREAAAQRLVEQQREARLAARIQGIEASYRPQFELLTKILLGGGGVLAILSLISVVENWIKGGIGSALWHLIKAGFVSAISLAILYAVLEYCGRMIVRSQDEDIRAARQRAKDYPDG